jgi:hypothetical protein
MLLLAAPDTRWPRALTAVSLSLLVLLRPEAPLYAALVIAADSLRDPAGLRRGVRRHAWLIAPVLAVMAAQHVFRLTYFGDPLPNAYYAKLSGLNALRLVNVFGVGWRYTLEWLWATGLLLAVPVLVLATPRGAAPMLSRAMAAIGAQVAFVLMVNGDWMKGFRFFAAAHAPMAVWLAAALVRLRGAHGRARSLVVALVLAGAIGLGTISELVDFWRAPPTPMHRIAQVARTFQELARRLDVDHPRIAWHDSGGSSYLAGIDVLDLGGLGNRDIARHRRDREFMRFYLFERARPTFFLSSDRAFAALWCGFHHMEEFARDYATLELPRALGLRAPICAIRREVVHEVPGVKVVRTQGRIERVVAEFPLPSPGDEDLPSASALLSALSPGPVSSR